eukprot:451070_1
MTRCPYSSCQSTNISYRYYSSSSWVSTWKCDMCEDEIYSGSNYYHCRSCCDRGGSSHEPEVKACSGMYCTYCTNKKNNEWEQEKQKLQAAKDKAEKDLSDEKVRQNKVKQEKIELSANTQKKSDNYIAKCDDKITKLSNISSQTDSKSNESDIPNINELNEMEQTFTSLIQQNNANLAVVQEASQGIASEVNETETYETQQKTEAVIAKIESQQQVITQHKQKVRENITKINKEEIDIIQNENDTNIALIAAKREQNELHGLDQEIDTLRAELQSLGGKEINSNPSAVQKMNKAYDVLLQKLQEKHKNNKEYINELKTTKKRIGEIRTKLIITKSNNKYLMECLDKEYQRLNDVAQNVMVKFEQRATFFLSVTVGLKDDIIQKFEDYGIHDDWDEIMQLNDAELIDIGVEKKGIRNKILRIISQTNQKL